VNQVVLDLEDRRPGWAMPEWASHKLAEALPDGWELRRVQIPSDGSVHASSTPSPEVLQALEEATVREIASMTVGILGYGGIRLEVGHRVAALGCRVIGLKRSTARSEVRRSSIETVFGQAGLDVFHT